MNREVQVRFCERFGGASPPYLLDLLIKSWCKGLIFTVIIKVDAKSNLLYSVNFDDFLWILSSVKYHRYINDTELIINPVNYLVVFNY